MSLGGAFHTQLLDMIEYTDYMATFADPTRQLVDVEPWAYTIDGEVLSANITATAAQVFKTPMQGENDFVMFGINGFARTAVNPYGATALVVNPALLVQISDLSTGRTFFDSPTPMPFIAGQGGFPFLLPGCKIVKPRATLQTTVISAQVVTWTGFYMTFHGARLWYG